MLKERYETWLNEFKKKYTTIEPTLFDAFQSAYYIAASECLGKSELKLTDTEINNIIEDCIWKK